MSEFVSGVDPASFPEPFAGLYRNHLQLKGLRPKTVEAYARAHCAQAKRAAAIMSLIHSARLNGYDPYAYLKDVLTRLPTQLNSHIEELLPHRWMPADAAA
jgi:hypothetical protein